MDATVLQCSDTFAAMLPCVAVARAVGRWTRAPHRPSVGPNVGPRP